MTDLTEQELEESQFARTIKELDRMQEGVDALRAYVFNHQDLVGVFTGLTFYVDTQKRDDDWRDLTVQEVADTVRNMARGLPIGTLKKYFTDYAMEYSVRLEGQARVVFTVPRKSVCVQKVVGTKEVQRTDPNAPTITVTEDILEWECLPILAEVED